MKRNGPRGRILFIFVAFVISAIILGLLFIRKYEMSRMKPLPPPVTKEAGYLLVTLFFSTPDGEGLAREGREIEACTDTAECAEEVLEELVNGPVGEMTPTLPPKAVLHSVRFEGDTAVVDLGKEFFEGVPEGSHAEMMAIYSIVDSLAFNFSGIKAVKFLMEGEKATYLKHLDLTGPLSPDFSLEKISDLNTKPGSNSDVKDK